MTGAHDAACISCMPAAGGQEITNALLAFGRTLDPWRLIPALSDEASKLVYDDAFALVAADRRSRSYSMMMTPLRGRRIADSAGRLGSVRG